MTEQTSSSGGGNSALAFIVGGLVVIVAVLAGTAFYGLGYQLFYRDHSDPLRKVDAIVVLGFSAVRSLVLTSAVVTTLPASKCAGFSPDRFWRHVLGTAVAAQALARPLRRKPESLFIAGLLHDIGRLVMLSANPEGFARVIELAAERDCHLIDVETEVFGCDHTAVGAAIAQHWNFPAEIVEALAFHHNPAQTKPGSLAAIIHYADGIAKALDLEGAENTQMARLQPDAVNALGLDWQALTAVLTETHGRFEAHLPLLG